MTRAARAIVAATRDHNHIKDIDHERQRQALVETAQFVGERFDHLVGYRGDSPLAAKLALLRDALDHAPADGLVLEFGVATGLTMREIAARRPTCYGFDSFDGLPEHWRTGYTTGDFAQELPDVGTAELVVGWFDASLPAFLLEHPEPFAFVHMDADLYSSTKTVFDHGFDRFVPGTVIVFDEYFNYPGWKNHEHKAFTDFVEQYSGGFEYFGYNAMHEQVAVALT